MQKNNLVQHKHKKLLIFLVIPALIFLWPSPMYGETTYIMLMGESMKPVLEPGMLIIVKPEENYQVGDIVAYVDDDGNQIVHRIINEVDGKFVTKGDNNRSPDSGYVEKEHLLGRAVFAMPYMGYFFLFLRTPIGISIALILILVMFLGKLSRKTAYEKPLENNISTSEILKVAIITNVTNYIVVQIALATNVIPRSGEGLDPSMSSTIAFALWTVLLLFFHFIMTTQKDENMDIGKILKLVVVALCSLLIITHLTNITSLLSRIIGF